jgi:hypothetical protein
MHRPLAPLAALALTLLTLAGCTGDSPAAPEEPVAAVLPDGVVAFHGDGTLAPIASLDALGQARAFGMGFDGAEPNMGITSTGSVFASAGSTIVRSRDGGETWEAVHTHLLLNSDPMMWVDPWTDCIYNVPMFPILLASTIYESCDDGDTWGAIHSMNVGHGVYDHQKFATALPGPDAAPAVGALHPTVFIICYNALEYTSCAMSYDGGRTWPVDQPIWTSVPTEGNDPTCFGQQSHPTGAPDGTIVVAKAWGCEDPLVLVSRDSGVTWQMNPGPPGIGADTLDPEIAFTSDGTMYMLWQSERGEDFAYLARSSDYGASWSGVWNVTAPGLGSSIFAALHAGSPGRVAMAFHATNYTVYPSEAEDDARWHTYIVTSDDADTAQPTFVSRRVQPSSDPVQIGGICNGNQGCVDGNRNLLDFIDGAVAPDGRFYAVISDGCVGGCATDPEADPQDSRDSELVMTRLDGWSLFAGPAAAP